jgi:hypothetical protein
MNNYFDDQDLQLVHKKLVEEVAALEKSPDCVFCK